MVASEFEGKDIEYINKYNELDKNGLGENYTETKNQDTTKTIYIGKYLQDEDIILNESTKYQVLFSYLKKKEKKKLIQDGGDNIILQKDIFSSKTSGLVQIFSENLIKHNINLEIYNDKLYISLKFKDQIDPLIPYLKKEFFFKTKNEENVILLLAKKFEIYNALMKSMYLKDKVNEYFKSNKKINDFFLNNNFEKNTDTYTNLVNTTFFSSSYNVNNFEAEINEHTKWNDPNMQPINISHNLLLEENKNEIANLNLKKRKTEKYEFCENDNLEDKYTNLMNDNVMTNFEKEYFKTSNAENIEQVNIKKNELKMFDIKMCGTKEERRKLKEQMKLEKNEFLKIQKEEKKKRKEKKMLERKKMID